MQVTKERWGRSHIWWLVVLSINSDQSFSVKWSDLPSMHPAASELHLLVRIKISGFTERSKEQTCRWQDRHDLKELWTRTPSPLAKFFPDSHVYLFLFISPSCSGFFSFSVLFSFFPSFLLFESWRWWTIGFCVIRARNHNDVSATLAGAFQRCLELII